MSKMHFRLNSLMKDDGNGNPAFASSYSVTAYAMGAFPSASHSGGAPVVRAGHGFRDNDYLMVGTDETTLRKVATANATSLTLDSGTLDVTAGDILINLGQDTGVTSPNYDGSPLSIYTQDNVPISNATVTTDATGSYNYAYDGSNYWEVVRDADGTPVKIVVVTHDNTAGDRVAFTDQDATPSVYMGTNFVTANTVATTISMFDDGYVNQRITVHINDAYTSFDFTDTNLKGNEGADWDAANGSYLTAWFDGTDWICTVTDVEGIDL